MKARPMYGVLLALTGVLVGAAAGCGGASDATFSSEVPTGSERGACRADGSCDAGLECRSDLCVGVGAGGKNNSSGGTNAPTAGNSSSTGGASSTGGVRAAGGDDAGGTSSSGGTIALGGTGMSDGGAGVGGSDGAAGAGGAAVECSGAHPLVSDKLRYCAADACYCNDPFDTCFSEVTAAACCESTPRCGDEPKDRGVNCSGTHPIVGPTRTCAPGNCFCSDGDAKKYDVCLPEAVAESCCPPGVSLTCVE